MSNQYVVKLNNSFLLITEDYDEAEEFYEKQIENWKEHYKDKVIENDDNLVFLNYTSGVTIKQFSKLDLL